MRRPLAPAIQHVAAYHDFVRFWGKARPPAADSSPQFHPVVYHLLDVASVVDAILEVRPLALHRAARLLRIPEAEARRLLVTLAGLHDIGKFAPAFQAKVPEQWPGSVLGPLGRTPILPGRHTEDGLALWLDEADGIGGWATERLWPGGDSTLLVLAPAVFGHHGRPVDVPKGSARERFHGAALGAARECADRVVRLLCPEPISAPPLTFWDARVASWWIAGLMTTADWIGSSQHWFPYAEPLAEDPTLAGYWAQARAAAGRAVREAGLMAPASAPRRSFRELTRLDRPPTPAQRWAETVSLPEGPCLVIVEDVTGAGKTEAAQVIVHRLLVEGRASGAYWAMPTQATANAMYARQADSLDRLYAGDASPRPSLVLAHGKQRLHEAFRATVLEGAGRTTVESIADEDELPGAVACTAFLADDRRAALLADVGAGTVDQALLGVLPSRFNTVRLFGLADKVLVVDEAHAYDAYMGVELRELLRFQAALGGCAVVLSATLPKNKRADMLQAWVGGLSKGGWSTDGDPSDAELRASDAYPLASLAGAEGVREEALGAAAWSERDVPVRMVHRLEDALSHAKRMADGGAAVAWIRNTVDDCLDAAARLREEGVEKILVFHARFAQSDRQAREKEVLHRFGTKAAAADRAGWVLVATQVVEQSLDLDFDVMVSDLAPIDLLIQRAGRLWRHAARDATRPADCIRELVVLSPVPSSDPPSDWLGGIFRGTTAVYRNAGVLWRTVQILAETGRIETPYGLRPLVEGVYGSDDPVPQAMQVATQRAEGEEACHAATAKYGVLDLAHGYDASATAWLSELRVPTRLGDDRTTVRLARIRPDGSLTPWADEQPAWRAWALSEVSVRATQIPHDAATLPVHASAAALVRKDWGRFEQDLPILPLREVEPGIWRGEILSPSSTTPRVFRYTAITGLASENARRYNVRSIPCDSGDEPRVANTPTSSLR